MYLTSLIREAGVAEILKIKRKWGEERKNRSSSGYGEAGLICVDKLEATKVVITGVYTPISNLDKQ